MIVSRVVALTNGEVPPRVNFVPRSLSLLHLATGCNMSDTQWQGVTDASEQPFHQRTQITFNNTIHHPFYTSVQLTRGAAICHRLLQCRSDRSIVQRASDTVQRVYNRSLVAQSV